MILSDREIRIALARGIVIITPPPREDAWSSTALDLRLSTQISRWEPSSGQGVKPPVFCPGDPQFDSLSLIKDYGRTLDITGSAYRVEPGTFHLGWTKERIKLPHLSRLAARVEGKSSLARIGLGVHVTAPTIHAGFGVKEKDSDYPGSPLQLEIWNFGPLTIELVPEMRICQLIFEEVHGTPDSGYAGKFAIQGPEPPPPNHP